MKLAIPFRLVLLLIVFLAFLVSMVRGEWQSSQRAASGTIKPVAISTRPLTVTGKVNVNLPVMVTVHCPKIPLDCSCLAPLTEGYLKTAFDLDNRGRDHLLVEVNAAEYLPTTLGPYHLEPSSDSLDLGEVKLQRRQKVDITRGPDVLRDPNVLKEIRIIDTKQPYQPGAPTFPRTTGLAPGQTLTRSQPPALDPSMIPKGPNAPAQAPPPSVDTGTAPAGLRPPAPAGLPPSAPAGPPPAGTPP